MNATKEMSHAICEIAQEMYYPRQRAAHDSYTADKISITNYTKGTGEALQKLIVSQLVKKFPAFSGTRISLRQ